MRFAFIGRDNLRPARVVSHLSGGNFGIIENLTVTGYQGQANPGGLTVKVGEHLGLNIIGMVFQAQRQQVALFGQGIQNVGAIDPIKEHDRADISKHQSYGGNT